MPVLLDRCRLALLLLFTVMFTGPITAVQAQGGTNLIDGFVFHDAVPDDLFGRGDVALLGATITLRDAAGTLVASTITDVNGQFQFRGLPTGAYTITQTDLPGFGSVDAMPGTAAVNVDLNTIQIRMTAGPTTYAGNLFLDRPMAVPPPVG